MLHDIEKLKENQNKALAEAVEANRIALALPVFPGRVGFADRPIPWVTYDVATLSEALSLFKQYTPAPYVIARSSSFTTICLEEELEGKNKNGRDNYEVDFCIDGAPYFDCMAGAGLSSTEMEFFSIAAGRMLKIIVRIQYSPIRVRLLVMDAYARNPGTKYHKEYPAIPGASVIRWGYGGECCKGTYWFSDVETFWAAMNTYEGQ